ncbi:hypothetical protein D9757_015510 [Collybiopsis confluens]|uniref:Uncharacterized protein n=1 Tax=Collybiopsis confluens TaxID=2823264 RepID=A0A8H5C6S9_9AGAR|nr:hypothetical protein D9757_015510 [Collybiopsis confluens]
MVYFPNLESRTLDDFTHVRKTIASADADDFIRSQNWPKFQFTRSPDASGTEQIIEGDDGEDQRDNQFDIALEDDSKDSLEFPSRHHSDNNLMYKSKCYDLNDKEDTRSFHSV